MLKYKVMYNYDGKIDDYPDDILVILEMFFWYPGPLSVLFNR